MSKKFYYVCLVIGAGVSLGEGFSLLNYRAPTLITLLMLVVALVLQLIGVIGPLFFIRPSRIDVPKYTAKMSCDVCNHDLTADQVYHSHGCCPYCGACSSSSVVSHKTVPTRLEI